MNSHILILVFQTRNSATIFYFYATLTASNNPKGAEQVPPLSFPEKKEELTRMWSCVAADVAL